MTVSAVAGGGGRGRGGRAMIGRAAIAPAAVLALLLAHGCGGREEPAAPGPAPSALALEAGAVARVGGDAIRGDSVGRVAAAQGVDPKRARDLAIQDALLAEEARARGLDRRPEVDQSVQALLARRVLLELRSEAERAGPVTDAELAEVTARHWLDLDRPEGFRTVHAVVILDAKADEAKRGRAAEVARAAAEAAAATRDAVAATAAPPLHGFESLPDDPGAALFKAAAEKVPHAGLEVKVETLAPVTADGRVLGAGRYDPAFSGAAGALVRRGDLSPVTQGMSGLHVIMLLDRVPPQRVPADERRRLVHDEVITDRARAAQAALLDRRRQAVQIDRSVDALLAEVPVERPAGPPTGPPTVRP